MVIKKIFTKIKSIENKEIKNLDKNILNKTKTQILKKQNEDNEDGDTNFKDGLKIFFTEEGVIENKKVKISQNEEGSNIETFKNPKKKSKSRDDEIYSDFTDKPFIQNKEPAKEEIEEFKMTSITNTETGENKIIMNKSKKTKKTYNRGF